MFHSTLVVDDQMSTGMVVTQILRHFGVEEVQIASDGAEALSRLDSSQYDLVIADVNMPNVNGLELLRRIRTSPNFGSVPVILISAEADLHMMSEGLEAGADAFLVKPFSAPALHQKMQWVSANRRADATT